MVAWQPPADSPGGVGGVTQPAGVTAGDSDQCRHLMILHLTFKARTLSSVLGQDTWTHLQQAQVKAVHPQNQLAWAAGGRSEDVKNAGEPAQPGISRNHPEAGADGNAAGGGGARDGAPGGR